MGNAHVKDLGKYRLIAELAHGGMGDVYLALPRGPMAFDKLVVVKELRPSLAEDPQFFAMFLDEARLAARLNHPNVVQTNEVGTDGRRCFLAMEHLEGQTLHAIAHRLRAAGGLPQAEHLRVLVDVCAGLHYAHELADFDGTRLDVVHRDVSPHNVFVTYDGAVKVVDFGIAKASDSKQETRAGVLKGKVTYMAPEQARGDVVDRRADVFSVGVMVWEAATGARMWRDVAELAILHRLATGAIPSARSVSPAVPEALDAICAKAVAARASDRYGSAAELQAALEEYLATHGGAPPLRDVGRRVAEAFREERARITSIVDAQLKRVRALPTGEYEAAQLARLDLPHALFSSPTVVASTTGSPDLTRTPVTSVAGVAATRAAQEAAPTRTRPSRAAALVSFGTVLAIGTVVVLAVGAGRQTTPRPREAAPTPTASDVAEQIAPAPAITRAAPPPASAAAARTADKAPTPAAAPAWSERESPRRTVRAMRPVVGPNEPTSPATQLPAPAREAAPPQAPVREAAPAPARTKRHIDTEDPYTP